MDVKNAKNIQKVDISNKCSKQKRWYFFVTL